MGTAAVRPGGRQRIALVLLRSTLGVFWLLIPPCTFDDIRALTQLALESPASCIPALQKLLNSQPASATFGNEVATADFDKAIAARGHVLLPGLTHLRSISSPARHWGDC